jgi:lipopolysaccharide transport system ATP-binding protein
MSRAEIRRKFDEIVAFSEVERFLDTPVKRYSSGMYVRLAFAVAAHLEPEILIVDEVLAVGDAQFQKKCMGKMQDVAASEGRTILFVSHNLGAVSALCSSALVLASGRNVFRGPTLDAITVYNQSRSPLAAGASGPQGDPSVCVDSCRLAQENDATSLLIDVTIRTTRPLRASLELLLESTAGQPVGLADAGTLHPGRILDLPPGEHQTTWALDVSHLALGQYFVTAQLVEPMIRKLSVHEYPHPVEINRAAHGGAVRVLDQGWQVGHVEFPMRRVR